MNTNKNVAVTRELLLIIKTLFGPSARLHHDDVKQWGRPEANDRLVYMQGEFRVDLPDGKSLDLFASFAIWHDGLRWRRMVNGKDVTISFNEGKHVLCLSDEKGGFLLAKKGETRSEIMSFLQKIEPSLVRFVPAQ